MLGLTLNDVYNNVASTVGLPVFIGATVEIWLGFIETMLVPVSVGIVLETAEADTLGASLKGELDGAAVGTTVGFKDGTLLG